VKSMGRCLCLLIMALLVCTNTCQAADEDYVRQLQELADQGDSESQFALALLYEYGEQGVSRDPEKALAWFLKAGDHEVPAACLYLGIKYENGSGVEKNPVVAGRWYCCAASQGWAMAQFFLAELYKKGHGVKQDKSQALAWYGLAAEQDYPGVKEAIAQLATTMSDAERKKGVALQPGLLDGKKACDDL
jgi:TPR repeat protein